MAFTYQDGNTVRTFLDSLAQASSNDAIRAAYYRGEDLSRFYPQLIQGGIPGIGNTGDRLTSFGVSDPLNNLNAAVPDAQEGSLIPTGNDLGGFALALAPLAMMVGGFAGVGGLSNAGFGAEGAAGALSGEAAGSSGIAYGGGGVGAEVAGAYPAGWENTLGSGWEGAVADSAVQNAALGGAGGPLANTAAAAGAGAAGTGFNAPVGGFLGNILPNGTTVGDVMMGGQLIGSALQGGAALLGANTQANAAQRATDATMGMFNTLNAQGAPYRAAGYQALGQIMDPAAQAYFTKQFGPADLQAGLAPGYEFMRDQGMRAVKNAANAQTGLLSGNTIKGAIDYATNYALNAGYQPSFQNFESQRQGIYNRLASIAGLGQTANQQSVSAGTGLAPTIGQTMQNYGTALGGGFVGAGNALAGGLNNAASWYALPSILNMGRA